MKYSTAKHLRLKLFTAIIFPALLFPVVTPAGGFGEHALWNDGLAEVATYQAKKKIYGVLRDHEAVMITVKEDFSREMYTKADPPYEGKKLLPVLKVNLFSRIETDNYPYHYLVSLFVKRNDLFHPVKMTVSSQEWCGNTFKLFKNWQSPPSFEYHSYFDEQGDGETTVNFQSGDLLREQLLISLRDIPFQEGYRKTFRLLESQMTNKFKKPTWQQAELVVVGEEDVETPAGTIRSWRLNITSYNDRISIWFSRDYPHPLVKYFDASGEEMILKEISRSAYWKRS
jgi:hypothetical protein